MRKILKKYRQKYRALGKPRPVLVEENLTGGSQIYWVWVYGRPRLQLARTHVVPNYINTEKKSEEFPTRIAGPTVWVRKQPQIYDCEALPNTRKQILGTDIFEELCFKNREHTRATPISEKNYLSVSIYIYLFKTSSNERITNDTHNLKTDLQVEASYRNSK